MRALYHYQKNYLQTPGNDVMVHQAIAETAVLTHAQLEDCMEKILDLEKWDRATLQMPANLRAKQLKIILVD
jgi:hypothetical protein